jgi:hypothetical protein
MRGTTSQPNNTRAKTIDTNTITHAHPLFMPLRSSLVTAALMIIAITIANNSSSMALTIFSNSHNKITSDAVRKIAFARVAYKLVVGGSFITWVYLLYRLKFLCHR